VRLATEKKAKTIPFLPDYDANKKTGFNDFAGNFKKLEELKPCSKNSHTSNQQRVIFIGVKRLSPDVSIVEAINDGLNKPEIDDLNLNLNDSSLYRIIYDPKQENYWPSFPINGKDKKGKRVIFDFYILRNEKAWYSGSDHEFTSFASQGKKPISELISLIKGSGLESSLEVSDIWISFGVASCDGKHTDNENLALSRASNLQSDVLKKIKVSRANQPQYARVVLGQYNGKCDNNYIVMAEQRPIVMVVGTQASPDNPANIKEALYDALQALEKSQTLLGEVTMSDFTITNPNKVVKIP
jgi:hypothetical protein